MAATLTPRRQGADRQPASTPRLFIVRFLGSPRFEWQIRKFGSVIVSRSEQGFSSEDQARAAGETAFTKLYRDNDNG